MMSDWNEYSKLVLTDLKRLSRAVDDLEDTITDLKVQIARHDEKLGRTSALYGAASGLVIAIITAVIINYVVDDEPKIVYKDRSKIELTHD